MKDLVIHNRINTISEYLIDEISIVFNQFFSQNSRILYVTDCWERLKGIITIKDFLECLKNKNRDYVKTKCCVLYEKCENELLSEAKDLVERFHITTAIPVLDEENRILYEIISNFEGKTQQDILQSYQNKFLRYLYSYYLKEDIVILKKVLSEQKIVIIGMEKDFDAMLGLLFPDKKNLIFIENNIEDGYKLLCKHNTLLIDLTTSEHSTRNEIYAICNNGYGWEKFWDTVFIHLEQSNMSMMYRVVEQRKDIFKSYLDKYTEGAVSIRTNSILSSWMIECLEKNFKKIKIKKELFRPEVFKTKLIFNGEVGEFIFTDCTIFCQLVDKLIQWSELYTQLTNQVKILNITCDDRLYFSEGERERFQSVLQVHKYLAELESGKLKHTIFDNSKKTNIYFQNLFLGKGVSQRRSFENDINLFYDCNQPLVHIENGIRSTWGQPEEYFATIYIIGACTIFGGFVEDKWTIPSLIQEKINRTRKQYRVVNLGSIISIDYERLIKRLKLCPEDIFVVLYPMVTKEILEVVPMIELADKINAMRKQTYPGKDIFLDVPMHCSDFGSEIYAQCIWDELKKYLQDGQPLLKNHIYDLFLPDYRDLNILYDFDEYLSKLRQQKGQIPKSSNTIGSIVMNCNPFTLGHQYLIEEALKQVDFLIIFVVEEDNSIFTFKDRLEMVRQGTQNFKNIAVMGSGKMMISNITFSEYFKKEFKEIQNNTICAVYDLAVFGKYIVPELGITYRFVGQEPLDHITNQYNEDMKKVLPSFGIKVVEIPRKEMSNGQVISASKVRKALRDRDYEQLNFMLPKSSFDYVMHSHYFKSRIFAEYN